MTKYPRIKTYKGKILIVMVLDETGEETTDWYSLKEIRQILKEQKEEELLLEEIKSRGLNPLPKRNKTK